MHCCCKINAIPSKYLKSVLDKKNIEKHILYNTIFMFIQGHSPKNVRIWHSSIFEKSKNEILNNCIIEEEKQGESPSIYKMYLVGI